MKNIFRALLFYACFFLVHDGLAQSAKKAFDEYAFKTVQVQNNTWGYDIYVNNKHKIHQPNIPGKAGKEGFKTKEDAQKVAELVIKKMKKGEMPPTVTKGELKNLGI
jgi:hypothetical protein